jgi:hypothetical protein
MTMRSNRPLQIKMLAFVALATGCNLYFDADTKNACNIAEDCITGYSCTNSVCVRDPVVDARPSPSDAPSVDAPPGDYFGTVEQMTAMSAVSSGVTGNGFDTIAAATTVADTLGCVVVGDLRASPGPGAVVYAKIRGNSDIRCPSGTFTILDDPSLCMHTGPLELWPGCALYKRWDATGTLVASQRGIGGYVSFQSILVAAGEFSNKYRCDAEMSIRFPGNITINKTFSFNYTSGGPTKFCTHD